MTAFENCGYIFSKAELMHLLGLMGANYIIGVSDAAAVTVNDDIRQSLIDKNYVFRDFDDELVLNADIADVLTTIADVNGFVSIKYTRGNIKETAYLYISDDDFALCEIRGEGNDRTVVSKYSDKSKIYHIIKEKADVDEVPQSKAGIKAVMPYKAFEQISALSENKSADAVKKLVDGIRVPESIIKMLEGLSNGRTGVFSIVFCENMKDAPQEQFCLIFCFDDEYIFNIDIGTDNVNISSLAYDDMLLKIKEMLNDIMFISVEEFKSLLI